MIVATIKEGMHKLAVVLVHFWFWNTDQSATIFYVYPDHLETNHERLQGKRIKIEIEIEEL